MPGRSHFLLLQRKLFILFLVFFQILFGMVYVSPMYHGFDQRIFFRVVFFLSKRIAFCSEYEFSMLNYHVFYRRSCDHGENCQNVLDLFWWRILTRPSNLVCQFYFYVLYLIRCGFFEMLISELEAFSHNTKNEVFH